MHTIKSVGVLSVAKIMGAMYAVLGLFFLPFVLLMGLVASMAPNQHNQNPFGPVIGLIFGIFAPIFYGVFGFIFGALGAFLYNLMARWLGGIEVKVESAGSVAQFAPIST
jgi:hypothetical protein